MKDILVSVIIPVYNTEKYIEDCLNSVLRQSHKNLEIILINDGSTDGSAQVCRKFEKEPRVIFVDRENRGLSKTRQQGIDMAKGTYFCNLDSDDMMDAEFVEKMLRRVVETGADMATCGREDFDEGYRKVFRLSAEKDFFPLTKEIVSEQFNTLSRQLWLADSWNKLYRTEFVRNSGVQYWLDNKYNGTDLSFNHLLCLHCPQIVVVNEPLLLHRIVAGSRVHRKNKPLQEGFEAIVDRTFTEADKLGYGDDFKDTYGRVYARYLFMVFNTIIEESESLKETKEGVMAFYRRRDAYGKKHPSLESKKLARVGVSFKERLLDSCVYDHQLLLSYLLFYRNKRKLRKIWGRKNESK